MKHTLEFRHSSLRTPLLPRTVTQSSQNITQKDKIFGAENDFVSASVMFILLCADMTGPDNLSPKPR